ncbi:MAG: type ISP restriction/modification enzyme [Bacteroidia bacterium]
MSIEEYIAEINKEFRTGRATEHSYRGYLQSLLKSILSDVMVTNEPARIRCGAPDYILTRNDIPIGYIEAKNIGDPDLDGKNKNGHKLQFDRYKGSLDNIIFTDYIDFHFYRNGELLTSVEIGQLAENISKGGTALFESEIQGKTENFEKFKNLIRDFSLQVTQSIKNSRQLAEMMAGKAKMLSLVIENALMEDKNSTENSNTQLQAQYFTFQENLIHDITIKEFSDIYAQTIAYGMFAARLHDKSLNTFSRQEAAELIPPSNPFLRKFFQYIAGYDLDIRITWIVDSLADIFRATDVAEILKSFGRTTSTNDPIIHFYETFLSEYDPALRKSRGVWYTPEPVVNFIVRAVDDVLKSDFLLKEGLASTSKTKIQRQVFTKNTSDKRSKVKERFTEEEVHKVQILDPAAGTGTFLAEVLKNIYNSFGQQRGLWNQYVEEHLVPRLNGFELLMASYAMAHLKLDLLLTDTGYKAKTDQNRFRIYLTNSLEEHHPDTGTLFASWLSSEANEANHIKRDTPVMCIIGNPPYSGVSANSNKWITELLESYKYIDGIHFKEKKHWLNDDYVKFIRYGQHYIEKKGSGILAYINPHGYLDNATFKAMRWNLLKKFDKIYIIDLHGNSKRKEKAPDGTADENVFDIMQGVTINIFIKTENKSDREFAEVYHFDLYGKRQAKYNFLLQNSLTSIPFQKINPTAPFFLFKPVGTDSADVESFQIEKLFIESTSGIQTSRDFLVVDPNKEELERRLDNFIDPQKTDDEIRNLFFQGSTGKKYKKGDTRGWKLTDVRAKLQKADFRTCIKEYSYRPFDKQYLCYTKLLVDWTREKVQNHMLRENISLTVGRQGQAAGDTSWNLIYAQNTISDLNLFYRGGGLVCPLYVYPDASQQSIGDQKRQPNLDPEIIGKISGMLNLEFVSEKQESAHTFSPIDVFDYVYAILHSNRYREKNKDKLKINFPEIPFPQTPERFWSLVELGGQLRKTHLHSSDNALEGITSYPEPGSNLVEKIILSGNRVYLNDVQFFEGVPAEVWNFYIGGYQPAQKWLKDRKNRVLKYNDITHYQNLVAGIFHTIELMQKIDDTGED